jgi:hypothetical protein
LISHELEFGEQEVTERLLADLEEIQRMLGRMRTRLREPRD